MCLEKVNQKKTVLYHTVQKCLSEPSWVMQLVGEKVTASSKSQYDFPSTTAASQDAQGQEITKSGKG